MSRLYRSLYTLAFVFFLLVATVYGLSTVVEGGGSLQLSQAIVERHLPRGSTILVSTVDGKLHAIDVTTGHNLWTFGTSDPLVTSSFQLSGPAGREEFSNNVPDASEDDDLLQSYTERYSSRYDDAQYASYKSHHYDQHDEILPDLYDAVIVPSLDGTLFYATENGLKRMPISLSQMVDAAPFRTADNTRYLGHKETTVFVIDRLSGAVQRVFSGGGLHEDFCRRESDTFDSVWIGKEQLTIQAISGVTGLPKWNVSVATYTPFFDTGMTDADKAERGKNYFDIPLVATTSGRLSYLNPLKQEVAWTRSFPTSRKPNAKDDSMIAAVYWVERDDGNSVNEMIEIPILYLQNTPGRAFTPAELCTGHILKMTRVMDPKDKSVFVSQQDGLVFALAHTVSAPVTPQHTASDAVAVIGFGDQNCKDQPFPACLFGGHIVLDDDFDSSPVVPLPPVEQLPPPKPKERIHWTTMVLSSVITMGVSTSVMYYFFIKKKKTGEDSPTTDGKEGEKTVGKITILENEVLGTGSRGTVVYGGLFEGRAVAVKRLVKMFYGNDGATKEINLLISSDSHAHVVRYHAKEEDANFIYVALERCAHSLGDIVEEQRGESKKELGFTLTETELHGVLREMTDGLAFIHSLNIVHRDLKPHNILLSKKKQAKIADMGMGKKLDVHRSSFDTQITGSVGWQPPELINCAYSNSHSSFMGMAVNSGSSSDSERRRASSSESSEGKRRKPSHRLTKSVDIFAVGCVIHYVLTNGGHPFGDVLEREKNIVDRKMKLSEIQSPSAKDLIQAMIVHEPYRRISAKEAVLHPFFWDDEKQLQFLLDVSDKIEDAEPHSDILIAIEYNAANVVGENWAEQCSGLLLDNLKKYRKYNVKSVKDCLRVIRNKKHHYHELSTDIKKEIGSLPSGFVRYFLERFPELLMHSYYVMASYCVSSETRTIRESEIKDSGKIIPEITPIFEKYFKGLSWARLQVLQERIKLHRRGWAPRKSDWEMGADC